MLESALPSDRPIALASVCRHVRRSNCLGVATAIVLSALFASCTAEAFPLNELGGPSNEVLRAKVGGSIANDSNILRLPGSAAQADTISTGYVGLSINKPYALQTFQLEVTETAYRYAKSTALNFNGQDYRGTWLWQLSPRLTGTLTSSQQQTQVPFDQTGGGGNGQRNVRISTNRAFSLDGWAFGGWHLLLSASQSDQKSSQAVLLQPNFQSTVYETGVRYVATSGNSIRFTRRATNGGYLDLAANPLLPASITNGFRQADSEVEASWSLNAKSSVTARLTHLDRTNTVLSQDNFSGLAGNLGYTWSATGKLNVTASASRALTPLLNQASSFIATDTYSLGPTWQLTTTTSAYARLSRTDYYFRGTGDTPAPGPVRKDAVTSNELGVSWAPSRGSTVSASLQRQSRTSNIPLSDFQSTLVTFRASLLF